MSSNMSPFRTRKGSEFPRSFWAFFTGPAVPSGVLGGSMEYFTRTPFFGTRCFFI
jgi:hypothetical protein